MEDFSKKVSFHKLIHDNGAELVKKLKQPIQKKRRYYRQSGLFVDQKLKNSPEDQQPIKMNIISSETKKKIAACGVEVRSVGVRLTPSQDKLLNAFMRLLHEKSENRDERSDKFYSGNLEAVIVPYGGNEQEARSATLRIFPAELYKAYLDSDDYSGADIKFIKSLLHDTEQQKFLIIYDRKYKVIDEKGSKEQRTDRIEVYQSLFQVIRFYEGLTREEKREIDSGNQEVQERRGELIIAFNPLLTDQINSKYVTYPVDINGRTTIAAGGHRFITESVIALRDYLLREISANRATSEINEETLIYTLKLEKYASSNRKKRIETRMSSAIQTAIELGVLNRYELILGAAGQRKYVFHNNLGFE